jgi:hypothetical protein
LTVELVLHEDYPATGAKRDEILAATAIVYDAKSQTVQLFGDTFSLPALRGDLEDVLQKIGNSLSTITSGPGWTSVTGE